MEDKTELYSPQPGSPDVSVTDKSSQKKSWRIIFLMSFIIIVLGISGWIGYQQLFINKVTNIPDQSVLDKTPTYFSYTTAELEALKNSEKPEEVTTTEDLYFWEEEAYKLVAKNQSVDVYASKVYAYLLVARRDVLLLTKSIVTDFRGDTSLISKKVLCEFYPTDCAGLVINNTDTFSEKLSDIVIQKVKKRIANDAARTHESVLKPDIKYWQSLEPKIGIDAASYQPWMLEKGDQFRVPEHPDFAVQKFDTQLAQVKNAWMNITSDQRKAVVFWAGGPGTKTPPGLWLDISGEYMLEKKVTVEKYLDTQALLGIAMADAVIAVFDSKYTYQVRRPFMLDASIKTVMPTPNHPSYPAGHSTISNAALVVLEKELPENSSEWQVLAKEAGLSRVWGGIHYPVDDEQGNILGKQVGEYALTHFKHQ